MLEDEYEAKDFVDKAEWIYWHDASRWSGGWRDADTMRKQNTSMIHTLGFVLREDKECVVVAQSLDIEHSNVDGVITIPKSTICDRWTLK